MVNYTFNWFLQFGHSLMQNKSSKNQSLFNLFNTTKSNIKNSKSNGLMLGAAGLNEFTIPRTIERDLDAIPTLLQSNVWLTTISSYCAVPSSHLSYGFFLSSPFGHRKLNDSFN